MVQANPPPPPTPLGTAVRVPPSAGAYTVAGLILGVLAGYWFSNAQAIWRDRDIAGGRSQISSATADSKLLKHRSNHDAEDGSSNDSESDDEATGELHSFAESRHEECKLVLVVRTDLGMTKGKIAAQCGHATLACYKTLLHADNPILQQWENLGQAKVALKVDSEDDMLLLQAQAVSLGLCAKVIHDAGRTQIASGSATVLGIGPAPKSKIDQVTGHLKLL